MEQKHEGVMALLNRVLPLFMVFPAGFRPFTLLWRWGWAGLGWVGPRWAEPDWAVWARWFGLAGCKRHKMYAIQLFNPNLLK